MISLPDTGGHFGPYGGRFVPETLMSPLEELEQAYRQACADPEFQAEIEKARVVLRRIPIERIQEVSLLWLDMPAADKKELQKILKIN